VPQENKELVYSFNISVCPTIQQSDADVPFPRKLLFECNINNTTNVTNITNTPEVAAATTIPLLL